MAKNGISRVENVEIDTESIKIGQKMAILGPKDVFKKVENCHYTSLGSSSIQTVGFIALKPC